MAGPEPYEEYDLGPVKQGKEAEIFLVERVASDGRSCLLAHKRYPPQQVRKGDLQSSGFQRASSFSSRRTYRDGRALRSSRDRRAAAKKTQYGRAVLRADWAMHEFATLTRLASAGVSVPDPVERTGDGLLMRYIGDHETAAPRLVQAGLSKNGLAEAARLLLENLRLMVEAGVVHGDLSAFNVLWWDDTVWIIDVPQALDLADEGGIEYLRRDLANIATWFTSRGVDLDPDRLFGELMRSLA